MSEFYNHDLMTIKLPDHSTNSRHYHHSSKHSHIQQSVNNWREERGHSGILRRLSLWKLWKKFLAIKHNFEKHIFKIHFKGILLQKKKKLLFSKLTTSLNNSDNYPLTLCCGEMSRHTEYLNFVFTSQLSD